MCSSDLIMVTAESKAENVVAAKQAGVSNYIVKPFNAETLRDKIEKVLGHASNSLQANGKGWNSAKINKNGKVGK